MPSVPEVVLRFVSRVKRLRMGSLVPRDRTTALKVAASLLVGAVAGYLLVGAKTDGASGASARQVAVVVEGVPVPLGEAESEKALDVARGLARNFLAAKMTLALPGAEPVSMTRDQLGVRVDLERLGALLAQARDPRSPMRRAYDRRHPARGEPPPALALPLPAVVDGARATLALVSVKDDYDRAPENARLDIQAQKVIPDVPGRRLDVHATLARLETAITKREAIVDGVSESVPAPRMASQIESVQWGDVIGYFETRYARDKKHEARTFNLQRAASKLDGHVLLPGEVFDFNEVVGPRNEANGYKIAPVIAQGELVDGIGGGTCQIAGTLHGAAFFGGLDIVERRPHTRPSFYIKMGMDAAVAYPTITLKLRNPFPYPVVLHETVQGGTVRAEVLGPKRTRDVTFVRKMAEVTPFQEKEVPDPKIPKGERVLKQRGIPGFKIVRYRLLRDGSFAVRERMQDVYPPTSQIWHVGTGDADPKFEPRDDEHPEYVADEYLAISQGPSIVAPKTGQPSAERGGAMVESRVAGKYGVHGWTVKEGFAKEPPPRKKPKEGGVNRRSDDDPPVD
ncbi:MAG: VanW family protein [Deltaproteobacteria bacterium]|nr:VanW family protein [Deltaproteobacteria bacterium]